MWREEDHLVLQIVAVQIRLPTVGHDGEPYGSAELSVLKPFFQAIKEAVAITVMSLSDGFFVAYGTGGLDVLKN